MTQTTKKPTLLESLCAANGQHGGTIHQFLDHNWWVDVGYMHGDFTVLTLAGVTFESKAALNKLAKLHKCTINWGK